MCNYRGLTNEIIRNRIVVSIQDNPIAEHLQIDPEQTLNKAISIARLGEILKKQQQTVKIQQHEAVSVNLYVTYYPQKNQWVAIWTKSTISFCRYDELSVQIRLLYSYEVSIL